MRPPFPDENHSIDFASAVRRTNSGRASAAESYRELVLAVVICFALFVSLWFKSRVQRKSALTWPLPSEWERDKTLLSVPPAGDRDTNKFKQVVPATRRGLRNLPG